jgi:AcrR family transcriptional regulator
VNEQDVDWMLAPLPSGRHGLPRELVVRSQRMRLLRAAIAVAGADGYAAMTVTTVIRRAGVSRKTFYEQFTDREACFLAAYELVIERALAGMHDAFAQAEAWPERLRAALSWALDALAAHPCEARVAFAEVLAAGPHALARRDRALERLDPLLAPGFDAAPAGAAIPASMPQATAGALFELIGRQVRAGRGECLPALLPELLFCALAPFVGPQRAAVAAAGQASRQPEYAASHEPPA